jgi:hypothetical protein
MAFLVTRVIANRPIQVKRDRPARKRPKRGCDRLDRPIVTSALGRSELAAVLEADRI